MQETLKYGFYWNMIGNVEEGRPFLGDSTRVEVYRLMQFCLRDVLERHCGTQTADEIFYDAGVLAGRHFYQHICGPAEDLNMLVHRLQESMCTMKMGILRLEKADPQSGDLVLTISEDLECSGLPEIDDEICTFDEGFLAGILEAFSGKAYHVKEIDCWCTGNRTCRFSAKARV